MILSRSFVGDVGTVILLDCGQEISDASVSDIKVKKPDGTTETWNGTVHEDKYVKYIIQIDDFNIRGEYKFQAYVQTPAWQGLGETVLWRVYENFE